MQRKTIVLVCMVDSIHVARWIAQFEPTEVRFILFPSGPNRRVHPKILEMIESGKSFDNQITIVPFGGKLSLPLWALDRFFGDRIRGLLLRRILKETPPDFVHALEFQHAGYVTMRALADKSITTPFIATNYGSDIYWFQKFPKHKVKIQRILARADRYSAECERDVRLAKEFGFGGVVLPVIPNSGGIDFLSLPEPAPFESRKLIAIKGYDGWVGRARWTLLALEKLEQKLEGFDLAIFSANRSVIKLAHKIEKRSNFTFTTHKKGSLSHEQVQELFASASMYVGVSLSDGLSTSMLEALANKCFAVQSATACTDGLITEGVNGLVITDISPDGVFSALSRAIKILRSRDSEKESSWDMEEFRSKYSRDRITRIARDYFYV